MSCRVEGMTKILTYYAVVKDAVNADKAESRLRSQGSS